MVFSHYRVFCSILSYKSIKRDDASDAFQCLAILVLNFKMWDIMEDMQLSNYREGLDGAKIKR